MTNAKNIQNTERKSDAVRRLVAQGDYKEALRIAKDFRLGISAEDSENMKIGYECIVHPVFYQSIGYDTEKESQKGVSVVIRLYGT